MRRVHVVHRRRVIDADHRGRDTEGGEDRITQPRTQRLVSHVARLHGVGYELCPSVENLDPAGVFTAAELVLGSGLSALHLVDVELLLEDQEATWVAVVPHRAVHVPERLEVEVDLAGCATDIAEATHEVVRVVVLELHHRAPGPGDGLAAALDGVAVRHRPAARASLMLDQLAADGDDLGREFEELIRGLIDADWPTVGVRQEPEALAVQLEVGSVGLPQLPARHVHIGAGQQAQERVVLDHAALGRPRLAVPRSLRRASPMSLAAPGRCRGSLCAENQKRQSGRSRRGRCHQPSGHHR